MFLPKLVPSSVRIDERPNILNMRKAFCLQVFFLFSLHLTYKEETENHTITIQIKLISMIINLGKRIHLFTEFQNCCNVLLQLKFTRTYLNPNFPAGSSIIPPLLPLCPLQCCCQDAPQLCVICGVFYTDLIAKC